MTTSDNTLYDHETPEYREQLVYELHHDQGHPLSVLSEMFEVSTGEIRQWMKTYRERTDNDAAHRQPGLFDI
ncbi:MAG: hypothetical protein C0482_16180 [Gordonia sp.]|nr:hypothetical protein [Gordonia sp. (in: high G+C Gram-positive bacteria)]